jgi:hypothetical protein
MVELAITTAIAIVGAIGLLEVIRGRTNGWWIHITAAVAFAIHASVVASIWWTVIAIAWLALVAALAWRALTMPGGGDG